MEENKTILTDEQLDEVSKVLSENHDPKTDTLQSVINEDVTTDTELEEAVVNVSIDKDGKEVILSDSEFIEGEAIPLLTEEPYELDAEKMTNKLKENFSSIYDMNDQDAQQMLEIVLRYKSGEKFSVFNALPKSIQTKVRASMLTSGAVATPQNIALFTNAMMDEMVSDAELDAAVADFQKSLETELNIPSINDFYSDYFREQMEENLLEKADIVEKVDPDKAELIRNISEAFTDSYNYTTVREFLKTNRKARKRIKDTSKYNRWCDEFDAAASKSRFQFRSIRLIMTAIEKVFPEYTEEDAKKFIIMICQAYKFMDHSNLVHTTLMYYTITHITNLSFIGAQKTDFSNIVINNIKELMSEILQAEIDIANENN